MCEILVRMLNTITCTTQITGVQFLGYYYHLSDVWCMSNVILNKENEIESTWCHVLGLHNNRSDNSIKLIVQTCTSHSHWSGEKSFSK